MTIIQVGRVPMDLNVHGQGSKQRARLLGEACCASLNGKPTDSDSRRFAEMSRRFLGKKLTDRRESHSEMERTISASVLYLNFRDNRASKFAVGRARHVFSSPFRSMSLYVFLSETALDRKPYSRTFE